MKTGELFDLLFRFDDRTSCLLNPFMMSEYFPKVWKQSVEISVKLMKYISSSEPVDSTEDFVLQQARTSSEEAEERKQPDTRAWRGDGRGIRTSVSDCGFFKAKGSVSEENCRVQSS